MRDADVPESVDRRTAPRKHTLMSPLLCFQTVIKEGMLTKQNNSFQRSKRRYFKLRGRTLYYAKTAKVRCSGGNLTREKLSEELQGETRFCVLILGKTFDSRSVILSEFCNTLGCWVLFVSSMFYFI